MHPRRPSFVLLSLSFALLIGVKLRAWESKRIPCRGKARVSNCPSLKSITSMD